MIILEGRKIPCEYENPLDDYLLLLCDKLVNICKKYNITPNQITLLRFHFLFIIYFYLFYTNNYLIPIIFAFFFYLFDCLDGHLARKTKQVTILGDILDHGIDLLFYIMSIYYIYINKYYKLLIIVIIFIYLSAIHLGIQQLNNKLLKPEEYCDEILNIFIYIHPFNHNDIKWSKYFGNGTLIFIILVSFYYIQSNK